MEQHTDWTTVEIGTEVKVKNERGRFTFVGVHENGDVSVYGGANGRAMFRAFTSDRCRPIQRRKKEAPRAMKT